MKRNIFILLTICILSVGNCWAQATFKPVKAGHSFTIDLPDYMSKTNGLNSASAIQFKSVLKDVYGFVIFDTKEELQLAELKFTSINEFYEDFIKDFLKDEKKRSIAKPVTLKVGDKTIVETDATYYDKDAESEIYYYVGIVETSQSYYKVLCWSTKENKETFKADFQKICHSLKD